MKKQHFISVMVLTALFTMMFVSVFSAPIEGAEGRENWVSAKNEYEIAMEETREMQAKGVMPAGKTPLEAYQNAFAQRARMRPDILKGMGYSDAEIQVLKEYLSGMCSFEEAAAQASAVLTSGFVFLTHNPAKYAVEYQWEWDKVPIGGGEAQCALEVCGIDGESGAFDIKADASSAFANYYSLSGAFYQTEPAEKELDGMTLTARFPSLKKSGSDSQWVWAKSGAVLLAVSPTVSGGKTFAALRAGGWYAVDQEPASKIPISISVNPNNGNLALAISFQTSPSRRVYAGITETCPAVEEAPALS